MHQSFSLKMVVVAMEVEHRVKLEAVLKVVEARA